MTTSTLEPKAVKTTTPVRETPSDFEVARRVSEIRSRWSVKERVERRYEAMRRFDALLTALVAPAA